MGPTPALTQREAPADRFEGFASTTNSTAPSAMPAPPATKPIVLASPSVLPLSTASTPFALHSFPAQFSETTLFLPSASAPMTPPSASPAAPAPIAIHAPTYIPL